MTKAEPFTTCFGLGRLPWAPGTWASLPPVIAYQVLGYLAPLAIVPVMIGFLLLGSWVSLMYGSSSRRQDSIVADVLAGQALTMLMIALLAPANICNSMALGFALYRLFDLFLPWPCRRWRHQPSGIGILTDDLIAGIYAGGLSCLLIVIFPVWFR